MRPCQLTWHSFDATLNRVRIVIAHGASGNAASMQPHVAGLARRGVDAVAIDLPVRQAEAAVPVYRARIEALPDSEAELVIGGQSYGGRVASLLAAGPDSHIAGLICFSYPLHRPGQPEWEVRTAHWPAIAAPVLFLSGESDPFARLDLLQRACAERLPGARLVTYAGLGHSLSPVLDAALDQAVAFLEEVVRPRLAQSAGSPP
jgi:predicted alpha/beta-hydrolase family hydrolase